MHSLGRMSFATWTVLFGLSLFVASVGCVELGRRLRARRPKEPELRTGPFDGAIYGMVGLLFGFTFYGAAERFLDRRELVGEKASAISTAWQRVELVQRERQGPMRAAIKRYLDARLAAYANPENTEATARAVEQVAAAKGELWRLVVESLKAPDPADQLALSVPMSDMFDIGEKRVHTTRLHPPRVIYALLTILSLIASLLGGYSLSGPPCGCTP